MKQIVIIILFIYFLKIIILNTNLCRNLTFEIIITMKYEYITHYMASTSFNAEFINYLRPKSCIDLPSTALSIVATSCLIAPFRFVNDQEL